MHPRTPKLVHRYVHSSRRTHYALLSLISITELITTILFHSLILHLFLLSSVTFWESLVIAVEEEVL